MPSWYKSGFVLENQVRRPAVPAEMSRAIFQFLSVRIIFTKWNKQIHNPFILRLDEGVHKELRYALYLFIQVSNHNDDGCTK